MRESRILLMAGVAVLMAGLTGVVYLASRTIIVRDFAVLERQHARKDIDAACDALVHELNDLGAATREYAESNQMCERVRAFDDKYMSENFCDATCNRLRLSFLLVFDVAGVEVFKKGFDYVHATKAAVPDQLLSRIVREGPQHGFLYHPHWRAHMLGLTVLGDRPAMVASYPILDIEGAGPKRGTLIMGRWLDNGQIGELSHLTHQCWRLYSWKDPAMPADMRVLRDRVWREKDRRYSQALNENVAAAYAAIPEVFNNPGVMLSVVGPRDIYEQGQATLRRFLWTLLAIAGAFCLGIQWLIVRGWKARMRAQHALHRYELLAENTNDIILFVRHEDSRILEANLAAVQAYGYSHGELVNLRMHDLRVPHEQDAIEHQMLQAETGGGLFETLHRRKDGSVFPVEVSSRVATMDHTRVLISVIQDITQRKLHELDRQQLLEAERAARGEIERVNRHKDDFLATLSHELRNPLSAILGWTRLLRNGDCSGPEQALRIIEQNSELLSRMISDMLDLSRTLSGKMRLDMQYVEANKAVCDVVDSFRLLAESRGIGLEDHYASEPIVLRADAARIHQAVANLLSNALKFTPAGGRVWVRVHRHGDCAHIVIRDTGQGIARAFVPHLFGRFLQADASTTRKHGGLGLGLAIVKQIAELHGGTVRGASAGCGKGATFRITLPVVTEKLPSGSTTDTEDGLALPAGLPVLLVDDDPDALTMVDRILADSGACVYEATSAGEALRLIAQRKPLVVLSDIGMPEEDGYSLIRRIRAAEGKEAHLPCVALTALDRPEDRERALGMGFDEHLSKLCEPSKIVRTVRGLVGGLVCTLPRKEDAGRLDAGTPKALPRPDAEVAVSGQADGGFHILLAEDSHHVADLLKQCLERKGYDVSVVASVATGIQVAGSKPVHLVLSDLRLADGMGWELMTRLGEHAPVPGIMMSGYEDHVYREKAKQVGFAEYLVKPVDPDELCEHVAQLLGNMQSASR